MKTPVSFWALDCQKLTGVEMISDVVGLRKLNLNKQLKEYLNRSLEERRALSPPLRSYVSRPWRVRDRLSQRDVAAIVKAFKAGTAKHVLTKRYGINLRSLKKLLREEGVKRKSWNDIQQ